MRLSDPHHGLAKPELSTELSATTKPKDDVIRKMLRAEREAPGEFADVLSELAPDWFLRAGKAAHDLNLRVAEISVSVLPRAQALEELPEKRVITMLERQGGNSGLLVFDAELLDALIEQQTLGEVLNTPRVDRPVTQIDISMSEPFRDAVLKQLHSLTEDTRHTETLGGFRVLRVESDIVRLGIDLSAARFEVLSAALDIGPGQKTGQIQFWIPVSQGEASAASARMPKDEMIEALQELSVPLEVVLPDLRVPVGVLRRLQPDTTITLDPALLSRAVLSDLTGRKIATARLGQLNGARAVRLQGGRAVPAPSPVPEFAPDALDISAALPVDDATLPDIPAPMMAADDPLDLEVQSGPMDFEAPDPADPMG